VVTDRPGVLTLRTALTTLRSTTTTQEKAISDTSRYPHIPPEAIADYQARAHARGAEMTHEDWAVADRLWRDHLKCSVCGWPMCAGQQGTHLSCADA
jgi:hypothetical protein